MNKIYYTTVDTRVHDYGNVAAYREVELDRLAAIAMSGQTQSPRFYTRIAAYLRNKFHFQLQPQANHHENQTTLMRRELSKK